MIKIIFYDKEWKINVFGETHQSKNENTIRNRLQKQINNIIEVKYFK